MPDEWHREATAPILGGPRPNQERAARSTPWTRGAGISAMPAPEAAESRLPPWQAAMREDPHRRDLKTSV